MPPFYFRQLILLAVVGILPTATLDRFSRWLIPDEEVIAAGPNPVFAYARRGMSLVELMIVVAIVAIFVLILAGPAVAIFGGGGGDVQVDATQQAKAYAAGMGYQDPRVQCVSWDSDGDGYVSCTVSFTQPNGTIGKDAVECAAGFNVMGAINDGCRTPKVPLNMNR